MKEKKLVPKRRFEGFMELWEEKTMEEVIDNLYNGQTPSRANKRYWKGEINWLSSGELNKGTVTKTIEKITEKGRKNANLKIVPKGTFIIAITGLEAAGTRGNCAVLGIDTTLNQSCMAIYPTKELLDSLYLFQWYMKNGEEYGLKYTQGTKQQSYNATLINKLKINMPVRLEQQKIGEFFKHLDQMISLEQRKLEKTKALKSAYLAEMFPAEGERIPKRRFSGFAGDWEERSFFENIRRTIDFRGRTPKKIGLGWSDTGYLALSALNVKNGYIDFHADGHYGNQELYDKWMTGSELKKGQVLFTTEAPMGNVAQVPDNRGYILSQRTISFDVDPQKITNDFLATLLRSDRIFMTLSNLSSGGTAKGVSQKSLEQLKVLVPKKLKEQQAIGDFFKKLDESINNQQQKLNKLKAMKEAYLEEMFV